MEFRDLPKENFVGDLEADGTHFDEDKHHKHDYTEVIKHNDFESVRVVKEETFFRKVLFLFLSANLWTLLMTFIPVFFNVGPSDYYPGHPGWYTGLQLRVVFILLNNTLNSFMCGA